jgi:hypothetical protein
VSSSVHALEPASRSLHPWPGRRVVIDRAMASSRIRSLMTAPEHAVYRCLLADQHRFASAVLHIG